nr:TIM barrel protein [Chloroflexia bacterium]
PLPRLEDRSTANTRKLFAEYGLTPAPGYLGAPLWQADQRESVVAEARRFAHRLRDADCTELYVAAGGPYVTASGQTRRELAGHVGPDDGLSDAEMSTLAATLNEIGAATLDEGVRSCFHNHVGQVIETRAEFERLLVLVDPAVVFLGPDTGHLAWAGDDPVTFCRDFADRIKTIHLKDIDPAVAERGRAEGWDYPAFKDGGIFAELGEGCVDFPAILGALEAAGFAGWMVVETDVTQKQSALESATISRTYLRQLG